MKAAHESKTVIANVLLLVVAILSLPQLNAVVPPSVTPYLLLISAVSNIVLRFLTGQPLSLTGK